MADRRGVLSLWWRFVVETVRGAFDPPGASDRFLQLAVEALDGDHERLGGLSVRRAAELSKTPSAVYSELGELYYERAQYEWALDAFAQAVAADAYGPAGLRGKAMSLHMLGRFEEATYYYLALVASAPDDADGQLNLGLAYQAQGRLANAIEQFHRAIALDEEDAFLRLALGRALYEQADFDAAEGELRRTIELEATNAEAHTYLGLTQEALGRMEEALANYRRAVELDPDDAEAHLRLASMLSDGDDADSVLLHGGEALRRFTALGNDENRARSHWVIAWGHYLKDEWKESIAASRAALEIDDSLTVVRLNLGLALFRDGQMDAAREAYDEAMAALDDVWDADEGIKDLEQAVLEAPDLDGAAGIIDRLRTRRAELLEQTKVESGVAGGD